MQHREGLLSNITIDDLPESMREFAKITGLDAALEFIYKNGGSYLYIPKMDAIIRQTRDRAIKKEFNGSNLSDIARKYNITTVTARRILFYNSNGTK